MKYLTPLLLLFCGSLALAAEPAPVAAREAYARALPPTVENTAAYMILVNTSGEELVLTGGASPAAESVMVHESVTEGGRMRMRHVTAAAIPSGGELVLEPGGMHLMITGLKTPLSAGDTLELTLRFRGGLEKTLQLPVRSLVE